MTVSGTADGVWSRTTVSGTVGCNAADHDLVRKQPRVPDTFRGANQEAHPDRWVGFDLRGKWNNTPTANRNG